MTFVLLISVISKISKIGQMAIAPGLLFLYQKMKSKLFLLIFLCYYSFSHLLIAQNQHFCGQHHVTRLWFKSNPNAEAEYLKSVAKITDALIAHRGQNKHLRNKIIFTIPVVFHILHEDGPENISDAQILDQMRILNRDYQKLNADTINVAPSFKNNIAVVGFEFVLFHY